MIIISLPPWVYYDVKFTICSGNKKKQSSVDMMIFDNLDYNNEEPGA